MNDKETLTKFKEVLAQTTGYYYPDKRAQYLLDKISEEATTLTHWLDGMSVKEIGEIDEAHSMRYKHKHN
jgi:hypothetical protein